MIVPQQSFKICKIKHVQKSKNLKRRLNHVTENMEDANTIAGIANWNVQNVKSFSNVEFVMILRNMIIFMILRMKKLIRWIDSK